MRIFSTIGAARLALFAPFLATLSRAFLSRFLLGVPALQIGDDEITLGLGQLDVTVVGNPLRLILARRVALEVLGRRPVSRDVAALVANALFPGRDPLPVFFTQG